MEILKEAKKKSLKKMNLPMLKTKKIEVKQPNFEFINLKQYFYKKKANVIISNELKNTLKNNLDKKKTAFILVQRRGGGKALMCLDCKNKMTCPKCNLPLVQVKDKYQCLHCNFKISSLSQCPKCKSFRIINLGFGTEIAHEKIKTIFPKARIETIDQTALKQKKFREKLFKKLKNNEIDILIGTQSIIKGFDLPNVSLTAILNAESWSGKSDFKFDERWLGSLFQIAGRVNRPGSFQDGKFIIQTFNPENPFFDYLKKWDWQSFSKKELETRKTIAYPPFSRFIKLIYRNNNKEKVDKNIKNVYNQLEKEQGKEILFIFPPFYGNIEKIRGSYQKFILIKTKPVKKYPLKIQKIFNKLGENWYFDVDPENIF
jgi:primosomal protein N' (replication factor Y)